jgi:hypothetical protein
MIIDYPLAKWLTITGILRMSAIARCVLKNGVMTSSGRPLTKAGLSK